MFTLQVNINIAHITCTEWRPRPFASYTGYARTVRSSGVLSPSPCQPLPSTHRRVISQSVIPAATHETASVATSPVCASPAGVVLTVSCSAVQSRLYSVVTGNVSARCSLVRYHTRQTTRRRRCRRAALSVTVPQCHSVTVSQCHMSRIHRCNTVPAHSTHKHSF